MYCTYKSRKRKERIVKKNRRNIKSQKYSPKRWVVRAVPTHGTRGSGNCLQGMKRLLRII